MIPLSILIALVLYDFLMGIHRKDGIIYSWKEIRHCKKVAEYWDLNELEY